MTKRLNVFMKYFGSKWRISPLYPKPMFNRICEPFAGSAQYATLYADTPDIVLVETDAEVAALWDYLIGSTEEEIRALPVDLEVGQDIREIEGISDGGKLLIRSWQRVGRQKCWTVSKWNNANAGLWGPSSRDRIAKQVKYIKHWTVFNKPVFHNNLEKQHIPSSWGAPWTFFIDPPYQGYPNVYGNDPIDFDKLAKWCYDLKEDGHQVIVAEKEGADWLPFQHLTENIAGRTCMDGKRGKYNEVFWHSHS